MEKDMVSINLTKSPLQQNPTTSAVEATSDFRNWGTAQGNKLHVEEDVQLKR